MINKEWRTNKGVATAQGSSESLTLTYEDRYLGKITSTLSPAHAKYLTLCCTRDQKTEDVVKYIKESILHALRKEKMK